MNIDYTSPSKHLLYLSILLNLVAFTIGARKAYQIYVVEAEAISNTTSSYNEVKAALFKALPKDKGEILFVGNSLTEDFPLELFQNPLVKNRGIAGDKTADVRARIGDILGGQPSKVFLAVGINDINAGTPFEEMAGNALAIIKIIQQKSPNTKIYLQTTLPIREGIGNTGQIIEDQNKKIVEWNDWLKFTAKTYDLILIDLYPAFLSKGALNGSLTWDGLHLNKSGYMVWKNQIQAYVN